MRINNHFISEIKKTYNQQQKIEDKFESTKVNRDDGIQLSKEAQVYKKAMKALKELPNNKEKTILDLKQQIKSGTYEINSGEIAEKILSESMFNKKI